jgi:rhamnogalacturonyl hydrolase YesR
MFPIPEFHKDLKAKARQAVLLSARWHKHNQIRHAWPYWTADAGRFHSAVNLIDPAERPMLSICWNTARGAQALLSAYTLTHDPDILETAVLAAEYVKTCQIFSPELSRHAGACFEETPQTDHIAARDTVEAIQTFINLYHVTKEKVYLDRAMAGADWFTGQFMKNSYPNGYVWVYDNDRGSVNDDFARLMLAAMALPLAQLYTITGESRYASAIPAVMDWVIENSLDPDGALRIHDGAEVSHHAVMDGPFANCFTNDDGVGVALVSAFRATGDEKYREAANRNGRWWRSINQFPDTYASIPAVLLFLLDMYRFTDEKDYLKASMPYIEKVLEMQHLDKAHPKVHGGFLGHDLCGDRERAIHTAEMDNYISHRTTMYAMMALAKVAASSEAEWNIAYSAFGW